MGAKGSKLCDTPEEYLRPRGGRNFSDVDLSKLKRLIMAGKLAPCFEGKEDEELEVSAKAPAKPCWLCRVACHLCVMHARQTQLRQEGPSVVKGLSL